MKLATCVGRWRAEIKLSDSIRVLHFADAHIGVETHGRPDPAGGLHSRVVDFLRSLDEILEAAKNEQPDLIVFAGDAFHKRNPRQRQQREFAKRMLVMSRIAPLVMLVGNHDMSKDQGGSSVDIYDTLEVPDIWVAAKFEVRRIQTRSGPVVVAAAPFPLRRNILDEDVLKNMTVPDQIIAVEELVNDRVCEMAAEADELAGKSEPRLLAGHFSVTGAFWASERQVMLGNDVVVKTPHLNDNRWDYVALGHIHKHQHVTAEQGDVPAVVYSGSIERITFNEENEPKGYCWVNLARRGTSWSFHELDNCRPMLTIDYACDETEADPTDEILGETETVDVADAIVRLRLTLTWAQAVMLRHEYIHAAFRKRGASRLVLAKNLTGKVNRLRLEAAAESLKEEELLDIYFETSGVARDRKAQLLSLADAVMGYSREESMTKAEHTAMVNEQIDESLEKILRERD